MQITSAPILDRTLAAGKEPPPDLFLPDRHSPDRFQASRHEYYAELAQDAVCKGIVGGLVGAAASNLRWWGPAGGAAVGAFLAWDKAHREKQGTLTIQNDGQTSQRKFYLLPQDFQLTPQEERARLLAAGRLGDTIPALAPSSSAGPPSAEWKACAPQLVELDKQRRLVADLGGKSVYGLSALHLIDANRAQQLATQGQPVYIVKAQAPQDIVHSFLIQGHNPEHTLAVAQSNDWVERKLDYTLTPLKNPQDLAGVGQGLGLPEGFQGIYRDLPSCSERVYLLDQGAGVHLSPSSESRRRDLHRVSRDDTAGLPPGSKGPLNREVGVHLTRHLNLAPLLAVAGGLAGEVAAMALCPGNGTVFLGALAGGVLGGRELGHYLVGQKGLAQVGRQETV